MRIKITSDGRVLDGTPEQIVQQMRSIAFGREDQTLVEYVDWLAENVARLSGVALAITGEGAAARSRSLLEQMLIHGLAERV